MEEAYFLRFKTAYLHILKKKLLIFLVSHANYLEKSIVNVVSEHLDAVNCDANKTSKSILLNNKHLRTEKINENNPPPQISCIETICDIVVEQLPDLWRLGQSYFTGQLHVAVDVEKQGHFKVRMRYV